MAYLSGFQANTTIHAAFWIYKPDPTINSVEKEQFIEVNSIQRIEATPEMILGNVSSVQVASGILTVTLPSVVGIRTQQSIIFTGLGNATFLNGNVAFITTVNSSANQITAKFTNPDYPNTAETQGQVLDASERKVFITYPNSAVSPRRLPPP
jgi:hypothetical protein